MDNAALSAPMLQYLEHVRVQKRLAPRTHTLYTLDLQRLSAMAAATWAAAFVSPAAAGAGMDLMPHSIQESPDWRIVNT